MIELLIIWQLCKVNREIAEQHDRSKNAFTAVTILLWLVPELVGMAIGAYFRLPVAPYFIGLLLGGLGGFISYWIVKCSKPNETELNEICE